MLPEIKATSFGGVNCYLVTTAIGFILIDTVYSKNRAEIEKELEKAGCARETLKLILLTHGYFDHSGNAAHLCRKYGAKIAIHIGDEGMVKKGDLFHNRNANFLMKLIGKIMLFFLRGGFKKDDRFTPAMHVEEGFNLPSSDLTPKSYTFLDTQKAP